MRMERLLSVLKGEAKNSIISIGTSGLFYASALKSFKRDFGDSFGSHTFEIEVCIR